MAADILLYQADLVPVGGDQKQHVEICRDIATRFNGIYGDTFKLPDPYIPQVGARVMSLTSPEKKMSKSDKDPNGCVYMLEKPEDILRKFKKAVTDSEACVRFDPADKPGVSNLMQIYAVATGKSFETIEQEFAGHGYGDFKQAVGESVVELLRPIREETERLLADKSYLESVYRAGAEKAAYVANRTLNKVYNVSFLMTPIVKTFAYKVGAIDVPKDARRMHKTPIPRLGGLAIFIGFMVSILLFVEITAEMRSILLGAVIIVVLGVVDDIMALPALLKFVVQIVAALIPATHGVVIQAFSNPNVFSDNPYWVLGNLSVPLTVLWIVAITNAVNLIDGLDGLANGVSAISATTVLVIALIGGQFQVAVVMAALVGACVGFMPYNMNPAKMFMGDTGATFLGYILATMSIQGLFKFYAIISFAVPFLILGLPIFDTAFAFIRRIAHGQSPMHADRSHIHHRLIDMGLNQKQAVATLYVISAILGLSAVVLTTSGEGRAMLLFLVLCIVAVVAARVVFPKEVKEELHEELEELKEHGHHGHHPADKPEDDGKTEEK